MVSAFSLPVAMLTGVTVAVMRPPGAIEASSGAETSSSPSRPLVLERVR